MEEKKIEWVDISERHSDIERFGAMLFNQGRWGFGFEIVNAFGGFEIELRFIKIQPAPYLPDFKELKTGNIIGTLRFDSVRQAKSRALKIAKVLELL